MAKRFTYGVNLAPLIDVVFILLAFMLIYSRLDVAQSIEVDLPQAKGENSEVEKPIVISIQKNGSFFWGTSMVSEEELQKHVAGLSQSQSVIVQADREANAEALIKLMSTLSRSGIRSANITVAGMAQ